MRRDLGPAADAITRGYPPRAVPPPAPGPRLGHGTAPRASASRTRTTSGGCSSGSASGRSGWTSSSACSAATGCRTRRSLPATWSCSGPTARRSGPATCSTTTTSSPSRRELLRCHEAAAAEIRSRWDAILVDEFQDLSLAQYAVVTGIAALHRNCFAVGDDEQSIFSWTGADPAILERFRTDFEIETPVVLDRNRRCSRQIFEAARRLVTRNPALFDKQLEADRESEHCVAAHVFEDERAEADWLLADLLSDRMTSGLDWGEYAVLYRPAPPGAIHRDPAGRGRHPLPPGPRSGPGRRRGDRLRGGLAPRHPRRPTIRSRSRRSPTRCCRRPLIEQVRAAHRGLELLDALRAFGRATPRGDAQARWAWRFIYHVENLVALGRSHQALGPLVDELLTQRIGPLPQSAGRARRRAGRSRRVARRGSAGRSAGRGGAARGDLGRAGPRGGARADPAGAGGSGRRRAPARARQPPGAARSGAPPPRPVAAAAVQGDAAPPLPWPRRPVPGLRGLRRGDHGPRRRRVRGRSSWPRCGCAGGCRSSSSTS